MTDKTTPSADRNAEMERHMQSRIDNLISVDSEDCGDCADDCNTERGFCDWHWNLLHVIPTLQSSLEAVTKERDAWKGDAEKMCAALEWIENHNFPCTDLEGCDCSGCTAKQALSSIPPSLNE
jgi:hypothetical protein